MTIFLAQKNNPDFNFVILRKKFSQNFLIFLEEFITEINLIFIQYRLYCLI